MKSSSAITVLAVGDVFIRDEAASALFDSTREVLTAADITFGNCEQPYAAHFPGVIPHLRSAGFDVMSMANNHILDYGNRPFLRTLEMLQAHGIAPVGAGANAADAHAPRVISRHGTEVAFLAYSSIQVPSCAAGVDRPGCAAIRVHTGYEQQFEEWPGYPPRIRTTAYPDDVEVMSKDIQEAKAGGRVVIVSMHFGPLLTHSTLAEYQQPVARAAIDAGADAVIGHHPHICKGIEIYRERPIFYSLGNFVMKTHAPVSTSYDSGGGVVTPAIVDLNRRTWPDEFGFDPEYPLFPFAPNRDTLKTFIARLTVEGGRLADVSLLPCLIRPDYQPHLLPVGSAEFEEVRMFLQRSSDEERLAVRLESDAEGIRVLDGQPEPSSRSMLGPA